MQKLVVLFQSVGEQSLEYEVELLQVLSFFGNQVVNSVVQVFEKHVLGTHRFQHWAVHLDWVDSVHVGVSSSTLFELEHEELHQLFDGSFVETLVLVGDHQGLLSFLVQLQDLFFVEVNQTVLLRVLLLDLAQLHQYVLALAVTLDHNFQLLGHLDLQFHWRLLLRQRNLVLLWLSLLAWFLLLGSRRSATRVEETMLEQNDSHQMVELSLCASWFERVVGGLLGQGGTLRLGLLNVPVESLAFNQFYLLV